MRAGTFSKQKGLSYKRKELRMNLTLNTFQRKYKNFD